MKKSLTNSFMAAALAAGSLAALPACTDGEIIASSILIGAAVISDDDCDHYHHHNRRPHYPNHPVKPGYGYVSPPHRTYALEADQAVEIQTSEAQPAAPEFVSTDERVIKTAEKYDISHYAATYVVRAIVLAQSKDMSGVKDLGLDKSDLKKIYKGQALEDVKIEAMAQKLIMSKEETAVLVDDISADVKAEKAARNN